MAHSNTVLSQILKFVPRHEFETMEKAYDGKRRKGAMTRWTQFVAMACVQLSGRSSLRDIESTLSSQSTLRYHLGSGVVKRSTLARANQVLNGEFFQAIFGKLYARCQQHSRGHQFGFKHKLFSLDATLLDVSLKVFPQAEYNRMKAAYKLHIGLDHDGLIPAFASVTVGQVGDQTAAKALTFPKGSVVVFDKGYSSYEWHNSLTNQGIFWVTRIRGNAKYKVIERREVNKAQGITSDQTIEYTSTRSKGYQLHQVRRIGYTDQDTGKHYVFITNHFDWSAKTVADIYKQRWQVELFFKWIKQNLKIKAFLGNTDNAVMTQVMIALCVYLILSFIKFQSRIGHSLQQMIRVIQTNLFSRRGLIELFKPPPEYKTPSPQLRMVL